MPRQTRLTPEVQAEIVKWLKAGNYFETACSVAGIPEETGRTWLARGRGTHPALDQREPYSTFSTAVEKAEAEGETASVLRIRKAAQGGEVVARKTKTVTKPDGTTITEVEEERSAPNWTADAWYLERKHSDRWGRKDRVKQEITGKDGGPVEVSSAHAKLGDMLARIAATRPTGDDPGEANAP